MPRTRRTQLHLHRDTLRLLVPRAGLLGTDPLQTGDTALCGPSRMETGCETARA